MHVVPFAHSFCAFDVVVGHIHAARISHGAIDDHNLAVVACKDVIDPRESDGVEFVDFDSFRTYGVKMLPLERTIVGGISKGIEQGAHFYTACARSSKRLKSRLAMESLRKLKYSKWMLFLA